MNCKKCNTSVFNEILHRTNPYGEDGIFMCMPCIEKEEPELAKNLKEDPHFKVVKDVQEAARD